ncbi:MAG: transglutaminase-like domain-containing protein [Planctomycetota bacterium]
MMQSSTSLNRRRMLVHSAGLSLSAVSLSGLASTRGLSDEPAGVKSAGEGDPAADSASTAAASTATPPVGTPSDYAPRVAASPSIETWRFGLMLDTPSTLTNIQATFPIPRDWPEQKVEVVTQNFDPRMRFSVRDLPGDLAKQVVVVSPKVVAGSTVNAYVDLKITKHNLMAPVQTDGLEWPQRVQKDMRNFIASSPHIDTSHGTIKRAYRDLVPNLPDGTWERVEAIYDFVRQEVRYEEGPIRNASDALKTGKGDCEDMTSLFVALCRNAKVPARMVWIPGHCYPEFYLRQPEGSGHWYPCQAAGSRAFGEMQETRPIMQKGDRFKVPEAKTPVRYLAETFRCSKQGRGNPKPKFLMEKIS